MSWKKILLILCLTVAPLLAAAESGLDPSCTGADPLDNQCPLDSWVYLLVLAPIAATLTAVYLRGKGLKYAEKNQKDNLTSINKESMGSLPPSDKQSEAA